MKKTLSISAIATLAALPVVAHATDLTQAQLDMGAAAGNDATAVATAGYVKSAYNVLAPVINTKADKTALQALEDTVTALGGGSNGSVAEQIQNNAEDATFTSDTVEVDGEDVPILSATSIGDAINELSDEKAEKTGVVATIGASTVTVPVSVVATWGNSTTSTINITTGVDSATYRD